MTMKPDFIVVRHLPTPMNEQGMSRGWKPVGIDKEAGQKLAPGIARTLKEHGVDTLVSSTLPRAEQSMKLIAGEMGSGVRTESSPRLKTWNSGTDVAGKPEKETIPIRQRYIKNSEIEIPGGESWDDFMDRFGVEVRAIQRRQDKGEKIALIGHGHQVLALPAILSGNPADPKALASLDEDYPPGTVWAVYENGELERLGGPSDGTDSTTKQSPAKSASRSRGGDEPQSVAASRSENSDWDE